MLHYIRLAFATQARFGGPVPRAGAKVSTASPNPPMGIFPTKGGGPNDYVYIYTSRANPEHWYRLLDVVGRSDLKGNPKFETGAARAACEPEVDEIVAQWTIRHDKHEAMRIIGAAGIPAGAVIDTQELADDQTFTDRGIMPIMDHPKVRGYKMPAWPVRHNGSPPPVVASPLLGEHSAEVLQSWLGKTAGDIAGLRRDKVVG